LLKREQKVFKAQGIWLLRNCSLNLHSDLGGVKILSLRMRIFHLEEFLPLYKLGRGSFLLATLEAQSKASGELEPNGTLAF